MRPSTMAVCGALVVLGCSTGGEPAAPEATESRPNGATDVDAAAPPLPTKLTRVAPPGGDVLTSTRLRDWPRIVPGVEARAFTSYDREDGNEDGFGGSYSTLYTTDAGEHVVFDAVGPGVLTTLWFTSAVDGNGPVALGRVRFRFDDEETPRIDIDSDELFRGTTAPFVAPLVAGNQQSSGGFASWVPLAFRSRLQITTQNRPGFYQAHYDTFPADWDVPSYTSGIADAALARAFEDTELSALPLDVVGADGIVPGPAMLDVLRFDAAAPATADQLRSARLRITFDDAALPQVDAPVGAFFGSGLGEAHVRSLVWTMDPGRYESRLPMPFWSRAHLEVTGLAGTLSVHRAPLPYAPGEAGYLEARAHEEAPTQDGVDYTYVSTAGTGKVVATVLTVLPGAPDLKQWWEGDLRSFVDARRSPQLHGTGHEDDHLGGWSNEFLDRPFSLPMQGCPRTEMLDMTGQYNANATMYRLYVGIPFFSSVLHVTEHGTSNHRDASYSSVTFLYRLPAVRTRMSDGFSVDDGAALTAHDYLIVSASSDVLQSRLEDASFTPLEAATIEATGPIAFTLSVPPANEGVELRRLFDTSGGIERAHVEVDGVDVGILQTVEPPRPRRWQERAFFLPKAVTAGKSRLHVRVVPEGSLHVARWEAWPVLPP